MSAARRFTIGWIVLLSIGRAAAAAGQPLTAEERDTFKGLSGVSVFVEPVGEVAERDGLSKVAIQRDVEQRLRDKGIQVYADLADSQRQSRAAPDLHVAVTAVRRSNGLYAYNITVELSQIVSSLVSNQTFWASTWKSGATGSIGVVQLSSVRESVKRQVDKFIADWMLVHQRK
jgi:hypothetical protein